MAPKKGSNLKTISIDSSNSHSRFRHTRDLVTRSEAALSSQATVYTARTQSTVGSQMGSLNDDYEFNREELAEVFITKEEETMIQQILEISRRGKINQRNAFEIPIKVMESESNDSANNKFWKFASELLSASMSIYDKRVENMYVSTSAMQNKLTRININIKDKNSRNNEDEDDIVQNEERRNNEEYNERMQMLSISADDFSGSLDMSSENFGHDTLEYKDKISIKNIESKYMADPIFLKTQKMFDSYSLKSLMVNIFPLRGNLQVQIFNEKNISSSTSNEKGAMTTKFDKNLSQPLKIEEKETNILSNKHRDGELNQDDEEETAEQIPPTFKQASNPDTDFWRESNHPISYELDKALKGCEFMIKESEFFKNIEDFIKLQPELKKEYITRKYRQSLTNEEQETVYDQETVKFGNLKDQTYGEILEKEKDYFNELYNEINGDGNQQQSTENSRILNNSEIFSNIHDDGLQEIHSMPGHDFSNGNDRELNMSQDSFMRSDGKLKYSQESFSENMFSHQYVSEQEPFFGINENNRQMEPIMPWEMEFKNSKLIKRKALKRNRRIKKEENEQQQQEGTEEKKKRNLANDGFHVDFTIEIEDEIKIFKQQTTFSEEAKKSKNNNNKRSKKLNKNKHLMPKEFEVETMYNMNRREKRLLETVILSQRDKEKNGNKDISFLGEMPFEGNKLLEMEEDTYLMDSDGHGENHHHQISEMLQMGGGEFSQLQRLSMFNTENTTEILGNFMGITNIREIKKYVLNEVLEKGETTVKEMTKLMPFSEAQMFTIFLHLVNENNLIIEQIGKGESDIQLKKDDNNLMVVEIEI